jgi:predicted DNA binding protein
MIEECLMTEFRIEGDGCPLADASREADAVIDASTPLLRTDGNVLLRFSSDDDGALTAALEADDRIRYLYRSERDGRYNYRCLSLEPCVVHELVSAGFMIEELTYTRGDAVLRGAVVGSEVLKQVMETAGDTVGVRLERVYTMRADERSPVTKRWDLTPAQEEAVRRATEMGYFTVPRGATALEVADSLGISKTAFLERLRRGQHALFSQLF